jgi:hypothetical protein
MKPKDLYALTPVLVERDIYPLNDFVHAMSYGDFAEDFEDKNERIELRYYARHMYDDRRCWTLFSVWFDGKPVMICQKAGREGGDYQHHFVTDIDAYRAMEEYILSAVVRDPELNPTLEPDEDNENVDSFYGDCLGKYYDPTLDPKYKAGDVVDAEVREDPFDFQNRQMVVARVLIDSVEPMNPSQTYHGLQLDRRVEGEIGKPWQMVTEKNKGNRWAHFGDDRVKGYSEDKSLPRK